MSINIYLRQIKSPLKDFIQLLKEGKYKVVGVDNLNLLYNQMKHLLTYLKILLL